MSGRAGGSCCSLNSARSSWRSDGGIVEWTSIRTTSANRRFRTSSWIRLRRSSASSLSSIWRSVLRVIRKVYQPRISTPGKRDSRWAPMTSSSGTNWLGEMSGTQRGRIFGTFTLANRSSPSVPRSTTARERLRFEM